MDRPSETDPTTNRKRLSTRAKWIIAAVIVLVLGATAAIAGPIFYRDVIVGPAAQAPSEELGELETSTLDEAQLAGDWTVAEGSYAGYRVDEVLNGTDVTVTGRTQQLSGTVTTTDTAVVSAMIEVDVASIATDSGSRDDYFRGVLLVDEHPTATFELTSPIEPAEEPSTETPQTVTATGVLTIAGVSRDVTAEISAAATGGVVRIAGQIPVTFADFGVEAPNLGFVQVEPTGFVEFLIDLEPVDRG